MFSCAALIPHARERTAARALGQSGACWLSGAPAARLRQSARFGGVTRTTSSRFSFQSGRATVVVCEDRKSAPKQQEPSPSPARPPSSSSPDRATTSSSDATALSRRLERLLAFFSDKDRSAWFGLVAASKNWGQVHGDFLDYLAALRAEGGSGAALATVEALLDELPRIEGKLRRSEELLEGFMRTRASRWREFVERHAAELDDEFLLYVNCRIERTEDYNERLDYDVALTSIIDFSELLKAEAKTAALTADGERAMGRIDVPQGQMGPLSQGDGYEKIDIDTSIGRVQAPSARLDPTEAPAGSLGRGLERVRRLYRSQPEARGLQLPLEVQIVQYLLMITDPLERRLALRDVFVPDRALKCDPELEELFATPENLLAAVDALVGSYEKQRGDPMIAKYLEESSLLEALGGIRAEILRFAVEEQGALDDAPPGFFDDEGPEGPAAPGPA